MDLTQYFLKTDTSDIAKYRCKKTHEQKRTIHVIHSMSFCSSIKCLPPPLCFFLIQDYTSCMKKLIIALLFLSVSGVFAAPKNLTVGETLTLYFNEIFPDTSEEINDIMVNYGDIGNRT